MQSGTGEIELNFVNWAAVLHLQLHTEQIGGTRDECLEAEPNHGVGRGRRHIDREAVRQLRLADSATA